MEGSIQRSTLKQALHRSVALEVEPGSGGRTLWKCYRSRGVLRRLLDHRRARREERALLALAAAGIPVPRPLGLRRGSEGWELGLEWLDSAGSLAEVLAREPEGAPEHGALARRLGRALAAAIERGWQPADVHAGNVLVGRAGECWLVDAARQRLGRPLAGRALEHVLVAWAADLRERASPTFRQRALLACLGALAIERRRSLGPRAELAARVELAARARRRRVLRHQSARYTRASSAMRPFALEGARGYRAPELSESALAAVLPALAAGAREPGRWCALEPALAHVAGLPDGLLLLRVEGPRRARALWRCLGRLALHGLAGARPLALLLGREARLLVALPEPARMPAEGERLLAGGHRHAVALGRAAGSLRDAGLALPARALWLGEGRAARALLVPARAELATCSDALLPADWSALLVGAPRLARAAFVLGFLQASRGGRRERALWRAELARG